MTKYLGILALVGLVWAPGLATAVVHTGTIIGDEAQATTCSAGSTSEIRGTLTYDDVTNLLSWNFTFGNNTPDFDDGGLFSGNPATFAHFHGPAAPGVSSPQILVTLTTANPNIASATVSPAIGDVMLDGLSYLNIHSATCGGGELRGQLLFANNVPSFSGGALVSLLLSLGAAAAFALRRRELSRAL